MGKPARRSPVRRATLHITKVFVMSKQTSGEGSIGKRKGGTYYGTIRLEGRLYALYFVAPATGMRQAELISLRWKNVQLVEKDGKQPHIRVLHRSARLKASQRDYHQRASTAGAISGSTRQPSRLFKHIAFCNTTSACVGKIHARTGMMAIWYFHLRLAHRSEQTTCGGTLRRR
jgi:integrase